MIQLLQQQSDVSIDKRERERKISSYGEEQRKIATFANQRERGSAKQIDRFLMGSNEGSL